MSAYIVGPLNMWIMCLRCCRKSFNLKDIANRYCGYCHQFHKNKKEKEKLDESKTTA